jgi:hypothetical protein
MKEIRGNNGWGPASFMEPERWDLFLLFSLIGRNKNMCFHDHDTLCRRLAYRKTFFIRHILTSADLRWQILWLASIRPSVPPDIGNNTQEGQMTIHGLFTSRPTLLPKTATTREPCYFPDFGPKFFASLLGGETCRWVSSSSRCPRIGTSGREHRSDHYRRQKPSILV